MKRYIAFFLSLICIIMMVGCTNAAPALSDIAPSEIIPIVMVNGELYYDTNKESETYERCGLMDGKITSSVGRSEVPTEDNQSNFGTDYEYQYGTDGRIDILINEKWAVFEKRTEDKTVPKPDGDDPSEPIDLISITSGSETITPHRLLLWSETSTKNGWLSTDGMPLIEKLPEIAQDLPLIKYSNDFSVKYKDNVSFKWLSIHGEDFELLHDNVELSYLEKLPKGTYYIGIVVVEKGKYIEAEQEYETYGYDFAFKLNVTMDTASNKYQFEVNSDNTVTITKYTGKDEEVIIPSEFDGKKVTAIGDNAFQGCTNLKTVTIPASVTVLRNCAFDDCPNLQSIYFEGDAPQTGNYVFYPPLPTIYYHEGAAGWTNPWYGCPAETY